MSDRTNKQTKHFQTIIVSHLTSNILTEKWLCMKLTEVRDCHIKFFSFFKRDKLLSMIIRFGLVRFNAMKLTHLLQRFPFLPRMHMHRAIKTGSDSTDP